MMIEFGRCSFSSRRGNKHHSDEGEPGGGFCSGHAGLLCHHSGRRLPPFPVLGMVKVCVSLVILSSRRLRSTRVADDWSPDVFPSAAAITCRSADCPSLTKGCLCAMRTSPTWFQPSTVVRTSFPVTWHNIEYRDDSQAGRRPHDPTGNSTDKRIVTACDSEDVKLKCSENACFTFTILIIST